MDKCEVLIIGAGIVGTYLAQKLATNGINVILIEKGGEDYANTSPAVQFKTRKNLSAITARNHVIGGNAKFWGGALVEDDGALTSLLFETKSNQVERSASVYKTIGIKNSTRKISPIKEHTLSLVRFPVLTGKFRNLWDKKPQNVKYLPNSEIISYSSIESRNFAKINSNGDICEIEFFSLVITAGMIDSHIVLNRIIPELCQNPSSRFGEKIHDHLSLKIANVKWRNNIELGMLFPPEFESKVTLGKRIEFTLDDKMKTRGFMHIQAPFDEVEPYKTIKELIFRKQRGHSIQTIFKLALSLIFEIPTMAKIAIYRYIFSRLYYASNNLVNLHIDIESQPSSQCLKIENGTPTLDWSLSDMDIENLLSATEIAADIFANLTLKSEEMMSSNMYFKSVHIDKINPHECVESLHLGGGLQGMVTRNKFTGLRSKIAGHPINVISTAIFPRPGVANPVHTLLVCAEALAEELTLEVRSYGASKL